MMMLSAPAGLKSSGFNRATSKLARQASDGLAGKSVHWDISGGMKGHKYVAPAKVDCLICFRPPTSLSGWSLRLTARTRTSITRFPFFPLFAAEGGKQGKEGYQYT